MTATRIHQLSWYMPRRLHLPPGVDAALVPHLPDALHYLDCYRDMRFGWNLASICFADHRPIPPLIEGDDLWVWRAYLFLHGHQDDAVLWAYILTMAEMSTIRGRLHAMLITKHISLQAIATELKIPFNVLEAYEKLFYNIIDRQADALYVSSIVYPHSRLVEMMEGYVQNTELETMLLRAGYNNGPADALYLAGMGLSPAGELKGRDSAERLESAIMANGFVMARNGFLNQSANAVGLMHSRQIIQAAKQAGEDSSQTSIFSSLGTALMGEIRMSARDDAALRLANAIDVTPAAARFGEGK